MAEVLWRYMDLAKFEDLIITSKIYFARGDQFQDSFEGRFSPGNEFGNSLSDQALQSRYPKIQVKGNEDAVELHRKCCFVSCWHRNTKEERAMWNQYTKSSESVVITTSVKSLDQFLPNSITKSPVKYHEEQSPRTQFDWNALFFYKPSTYAYEQEFRMLLNRDPQDSSSIDDPDDRARRVPISLRKIIHRVISHPNALSIFKSKVDLLLKEYLRTVGREDSSLV